MDAQVIIDRGSGVSDSLTFLIGKDDTHRSYSIIDSPTNYQTLRYLLTGSFTFSITDKDEKILVALPTHKSLTHTDGILIELKRESNTVNIFEKSKFSPEWQKLFRFSSKTDIPDIIDDGNFGSEVMMYLLNNNPKIDGLLKNFENLSCLLRYKDRPDQLLPLFIRLFQEERIIPKAWVGNNYSIHTLDILNPYKNTGLGDETIKRFVEAVLREMTGNLFKLEPTEGGKLELNIENNPTMSKLPIESHGSGVFSVIEYIPPLMEAFKRGDICFIGHDNDSVIGRWHGLMKMRFKEVYTHKFEEIYGRAPYNQIITC